MVFPLILQTEARLRGFARPRADLDPDEPRGTLIYQVWSQGQWRTRLTLPIFSPRWTRNPWFAWDFVPPTTRTQPVIRIALGRPARLDLNPRLLEALFPQATREAPILDIYRVQDDDAIPDLGEGIWPDRLVLPKHTFSEATERNRLQDALAEGGIPPRVPNTLEEMNQYQASLRSQNEPIIVSAPQGTKIQRSTLTDTWELSFRTNHRNVHSAYAYELTAAPSAERPFYEIHAVRTRHVSVSFTVSVDEREGVSDVLYKERIVQHSHQLPQQGEAIGTEGLVVPEGGGRTPGFDFRWRFSPRTRYTISGIETVLGFIPVVGDAYDIAQTIYTAATGEDFWGDPVSPQEMALMMVGCLITVVPMVGDSLATLQRGLRRFRRLRTVADVLGSEEVANAIRRNVDEHVHTVLNENPLLQRRLVRVMDQVARGRPYTAEIIEALAELDRLVREVSGRSGRRWIQQKITELPPGELYDLVSDSVEGLEPLRRAVDLDEWLVPAAERRRAMDSLGEYLAADIDADAFVGSLDPRIQARLAQEIERRDLRRIFTSDFRGFQNPELAQAFQRYRSRGGRANVARWARSQTRGKARQILLRELGNDFASRIRRGLSDQLIPNVTQEARGLFGRLFGLVDSYRDLLRTRRGFGHLFEADHLLEKRFSRSARVSGAFPDEDDLFAILVPKDPAVRRQLRDFPIYDHRTKTQLFNQLIPHGEEDLYSLQKWWDAHAWVYESLGLDRSLYRPRLMEQFEDIARASGESVNFNAPIRTAQEFVPDRDIGVLSP